MSDPEKPPRLPRGTPPGEWVFESGLIHMPLELRGRAGMRGYLQWRMPLCSTLVYLGKARPGLPAPTSAYRWYRWLYVLNDQEL